MKVTEVETIQIGEFPNLLHARIHTDEGLVGLGETFCAGASGRPQAQHPNQVPVGDRVLADQGVGDVRIATNRQVGIDDAAHLGEWRPAPGSEDHPASQAGLRLTSGGQAQPCRQKEGSASHRRSSEQAPDTVQDAARIMARDQGNSAVDQLNLWPVVEAIAGL